ncbi:CRISPR-associated endonuclease Cas1 [Thermanaerosceptrum fracticalcis]|uniref:CRISPR-associated endonuclease Cas1 n=1 Tax=Thermanaerosceptrum fracticalcis TaxID=1712410 RepID=A0A7G6E240_THEFR|nr:CRISPR-associated endonuclease Cas1 [Thermanaerosceptrum fracticalcis]QNB46144.1 CRISPR-associated endonuclease Cas1 [Thermanaerosceptrum fracticalcis]
MQLYISNFGSFLGKKSERLIVKENNKVVNEIPFHDLEQIIIDNPGVSLSTDCIRECVRHGIYISFLDFSGTPYASLISPYLVGTAMTRREQLMAYNDQRGIHLAKAFVEGKLKNQLNILKYFAKYRKGANRELYEQIYHGITWMEKFAEELKEIKGKCIDDIRGQIMSVEGRVGNIYWDMVKLLTDGKIEFPGREHRGAGDPFNSLLNYGYGILNQQIEKALVLAGLDIFCGYLHVDRPGKKSLVYDFIEEFRQPVVDRVVIAIVNKGIEIGMDGEYLDTQTKRDFAARIFERLDHKESFQGKKSALKTIIQNQARRIATFLRGEAKYKPFVSSW